MTMKIPKVWWFVGAYALTVILYWPSLEGTPIWDDRNFWFSDPNMRLGYRDYWMNFAWPLSVSIQKWLLGIFQKNYVFFHLLSLILHFLNSWLVYKLSRFLRLRYSFALFLLFLFHPVAVITTAWMIQIKTLLCFFFALSSLLLFMRGHHKKKYMILSCLAFLFSILSKSASLTLPVIFLIYTFKNFRFSKFYWLMPFFLISAWGGWRLIKSRVTVEGSQKAAIASSVKKTPDTRAPIPLESIPVTKPENLAPPLKVEIQIHKKPLSRPLKVTTQKPLVKKKKWSNKREKKASNIIASPKSPSEAKLSQPQERPGVVVERRMEPQPAPLWKNKLSHLELGLISQTLNYYFWQSLVPENNTPVKGLNYLKAGVFEIIHLLFLLIMILLFWNDVGLYYLGAAHFLLLPFLGIIPAPYMTVTWVSDQHLYLVLPALLAFWVRMLEKIPGQFVWVIPLLLISFFTWKTRQATPLYKNEFVFYEKCLEYNPYNVPMAYNLAFSHVMKGELALGYNVLKESFDLSEKEPLMRKNFFFPYLAQLYISLKDYLESHAR